jgi:capsular polysaccharide export protein
VETQPLASDVRARKTAAFCRPARTGGRKRRRPQGAACCYGLRPGATAKCRDTIPSRRIEDGLIRSRGLGADLVPPLSLVLDDLGIYFDPTRESRLERLIAPPLRPGQTRRAERLIARLVTAGVTKYNLGGALPAPSGRAPHSGAWPGRR